MVVVAGMVGSVVELGLEVGVVSEVGSVVVWWWFSWVGLVR